MNTQLIQGEDIQKKPINPKRAELIELSKQARLMREGLEEYQDATINEILLDIYSKGQEMQFNTFNQWKAKGFKVKKGEKAFLVWGKKRKVEQEPTTDESAKEFKFYPICFLFNESQVEKIVE